MGQASSTHLLRHCTTHDLQYHSAYNAHSISTSFFEFEKCSAFCPEWLPLIKCVVPTDFYMQSKAAAVLVFMSAAQGEGLTEQARPTFVLSIGTRPKSVLPSRHC